MYYHGAFEDYYEMLQISPNADSETIHRVYRILAQRYHPDNHDTCDPELIYRIEPGEPYFTDLRERWSAALRAAHIGIPRPPYANRR